jgi:hypothetical protein
VDSKRLPDKETTSVIGGVQSLEEAWSWSKKLNMCFDASSYEYSVIALCFALRVTEAEHRISEMKDKIQSHSDLNDSLIVCLVALARAHAMLGHQKEAQINAKAALSIIMQPTSECEASTQNNHMTANTKKEKQGATVGGMPALLYCLIIYIYIYIYILSHMNSRTFDLPSFFLFFWSKVNRGGNQSRLVAIMMIFAIAIDRRLMPSSVIIEAPS